MRTTISNVLLLLACVSTSPLLADTLADGKPPLKITITEPPDAEPFNLGDVRLLNGDFKTGQDIGEKYLLSLDPDRLLAGFRQQASLSKKAEPYGGWESRSIAGHTLGHYLSACSMAWRSTGNPEFLRRVNYIVAQLAECQKARGDGFFAAYPGVHKAYEEIAAGHITSSGFDLNGIWVPNYTTHKIFAGLRDAYRLCDNQQALQVARGLADFFVKIYSGLDDQQMQKVLACEYGGMNEVLADLYADTGDQDYLKLANRFHDHAILDPLAEGKDILPGKHANTQIPKLIGLATIYELTGDKQDELAAKFFWDRVVHDHSYVTGGDSDYEQFDDSDELNDHLSNNTTETCNVYNMLKLTEHIFGWHPSAAAMDFYERALLNQIRSSQKPDGQVTYYLSLKPGSHKDYQTLTNSFTCCVGTGMENHVKYGEAIYFHNDSNLWVNLFIASELSWEARDLKLRQETAWPDGDSSKITISTKQPQPLTLRIRHPFWANTLTVKINGKVVSDATSPSSYAVIDRVWKNGDTVDISFPMTLRTEAMPDNPNRIAIFYGPTLLAANLGPANDPKADQVGYVPVLLTENKPVTDWVKPVSLKSLTFKTVGVGKPRDVDLIPFHQIFNRRYTVYFDEFTADDWAKRAVEIQAAEKQQKELEARTVDIFQPGEMQPERDHNVQGEKTAPLEALGRKLRHAWDGGWFSYDMKVDPNATNELGCTWWGSETGQRNFDVLVDGIKIATQRLLNNDPGKFWNAVYPIPLDLTHNKQKVTIKLQAHPDNMAGGLFGSRMLRSEQK